MNIFHGGEMDNIDKTASYEKVATNVQQFSAGYAANFISQACTVESATHRLLSLWFPDGAQCASCGAQITGKRAMDTFWRGDRTYCSSCDSKFSPFSRTILDGSKLSAAQLEIILISYSLGLDHKTTARLAGVLPETVNHWTDKISFWESHAV